MSLPSDEEEPSRLEKVTRTIHAKIGDPSVTYLFGRKSLKLHEGARRICYVRDGGNVVAPRQTGAEEILNGRYRIAMCRTRAENVVAHLYAETDGVADDLLDALIAAICQVDPNPTFSRYNATSDEAEEAGEILRTYKYIVPFVLRLPVPSSIKPLRVITAIEHECGTLQPDGSITPQPD